MSAIVVQVQHLPANYIIFVTKNFNFLCQILKMMRLYQISQVHQLGNIVQQWLSEGLLKHDVQSVLLLVLTPLYIKRNSSVPALILGGVGSLPRASRFRGLTSPKRGPFKLQIALSKKIYAYSNCYTNISKARIVQCQLSCKNSSYNSIVYAAASYRHFEDRDTLIEQSP